ncbi:MAG: aspartate kinase [Bacteroidales bacterium]|nr:aspartate kinase [Bacteroidales bacterium]
MKVFKFGGASIKSAEAVKNLEKIVKMFNEPLLIVISAMGKMTNALEKVTEDYFNRNPRLQQSLQFVKDYHYAIIDGLFAGNTEEVYNDIGHTFARLEEKLEEEPSLHYNFEYDQVVCYGELLSTKIVAHYLQSEKPEVKWMDIRKYLKTDNNYREAKVNYEMSEKFVKEAFHFKDSKVYITQGFIGSTLNNLSTTLGREGSDFSAAVLAYFLDLKEVTIWKDVPGVLNADPKYFDNTVKLDKISYIDAIELAYYGTSVIHPKTVQPLQRKKIKLHVRSFVEPDLQGTIIGDDSYDTLIPSFIFKLGQVLVEFFPRDLSFIAEDNLEKIFGSFARHSLRMNLMQNSAVSFKVLVNNDASRINPVKAELEKEFDVKITEGLELITIRYYDENTIARVMKNKELIMEQRNQKTIQMVVKDLGTNNDTNAEKL